MQAELFEIMRHYYQDYAVTIFHGDCREIIPELMENGGGYDLLLCDPPYGINAAANKRANKQHGNAAAPSKDYGTSDWDASPPTDETIKLIRSVATKQIIWGGNYFVLPPRRGWLVWDKDNGNNGYADCELAWTNLEMAVRRLKYRWMGMLQEKAGADKEDRFHPTQKPLDVMSWCIRLAGEVKTIIDPFAGVCTTGRAAKDLGCHCICIEREQKYCEIGAMRMQQEVLKL